MDLELDDDQAALRDVARDYLDAYAPLAMARRRSDAEVAEQWRSTGQLGWFDLGTGSDEDLFGLVGAVIAAAEMGAHALRLPFAEHAAVVGRVLARAGDADQRHIWQRALAGGAPVCTAAILEPDCDWTLNGLQTRAEQVGRAWRIAGRKCGVPFAAQAGAIGVVAQTPDGPGLFLVERSAAGISFEPEAGFDPTRQSAAVVFDDVAVPADAAFTGPGAGDALARALLAAAVVTSAESYGAASALLDMVTQYAKERTQFGRPIGGFQALQHLLADMVVLRDTSWSTVLHAAGAIDAGLDDATASAHVAVAHTARATRMIGEGALQVLGGIGFSDEHDAHLLLGRILECEQRFGDAIAHEHVLAQMLSGEVSEVHA